LISFGSERKTFSAADGGGSPTVPTLGGANTTSINGSSGAPGQHLGAANKTLSGLGGPNNTNASADGQASQVLGAASDAFSTANTSNRSAGTDGQASQVLGASNSSCTMNAPIGGGPPGSAWTKASTNGSSSGIGPTAGQKAGSDYGSATQSAAVAEKASTVVGGTAVAVGLVATGIAATVACPLCAAVAEASTGVAAGATIAKGFFAFVQFVAQILAPTPASTPKPTPDPTTPTPTPNPNEPSPDGGSATGRGATSLAVIHGKHGISTNPGADDGANKSGAGVVHHSYNTNPGPDDSPSSHALAPKQVKKNVDP
jgi:hypothetical protein